MKKLGVAVVIIIIVTILLSFYDDWRINLFTIIMSKLFLLLGCCYILLKKEILLPKQFEKNKISIVLSYFAKILVSIIMVVMIYYSIPFFRDIVKIGKLNSIEIIKGRVKNVDKQFLLFSIRQTVFIEGYNNAFYAYNTNFIKNGFYQIQVLPESKIIIRKIKISDDLP